MHNNNISHISDLIDADWTLYQHTNFDKHTFHLIHMQLRGVFVDGLKKEAIGNTEVASNVREIRLQFPNCSLNGICSVPRKIPVVPRENTPYTFKNNCIYFNEIQIFEKETVIEIPLFENEIPRYLKGYSFPFLGTTNPFYELRIDPKNSGRCPGRCSFCHRDYSYRVLPSKVQQILSPIDIVEDIICKHGHNALKKVTHISVITELFGNEDAFLTYLEELKVTLLKSGCTNNVSFRACSQDVRSENGLRRLFSIVDHSQYSFTLEVFSQRTQIMGWYKGVDLKEVECILTTAKRIGFEKIKVNYVAGIDSFHVFDENMRHFRSANIIDSVGLSIFTAFFPDQIAIRNIDAWSIGYYLNIIDLIKELGIEIYEPTCFEMGYPVGMLSKYIA